MKKAISALMALVLVFCLAACGTTPAAKSSAPKASEAKTSEASSSATKSAKTVTALNIYGIYKSESAYFVNEAASAEATLKSMGKELGFNGTWHFCKCDADPEKCLTLVDTAIADHCDAILICVPDQTMSQSVVDRCKAAGVLVIAVDDGLIDGSKKKIAPWVGIAAYEIGYAAGEWMADYATEKKLLENKSVGLLYMTMGTVSSCVPRTQGEKEAWNKKAGKALSDRTFEADYVTTQEDAYNNASAVITGHPEITSWLVMVASEAGALGAGAALETAGLDKDSCVITLGCDETVNQWADGNYKVIRSAAYFSGKVVGKEAMKSAVNFLVKGTEIPMEYATPAVIVTPENYKQFVL